MKKQTASRLNRPFQRGVTLIELLVAITVGLLLIAAVSGLFIATKRTFQSQEGLSRNQEAGRIVLELLANEVRKAGYVGCAGMLGTGIESIFRNYVDPSQFMASMPLFVPSKMHPGGQELVRLRGYGSGNLWNGFPNDALPMAYNAAENPDVLLIQTADEDLTWLSKPMTAPTDNVPVAKIPRGIKNVAPGKTALAVVSDCNTSDLFAVTGITMNGVAHDANIGNVDGSLTKSYGGGLNNDASLGALAMKAFYVATNPDTGKKALYQMDRTFVGPLNGVAGQPLIDGVENMRIYYGVDAGPAGDFSVPPTGHVTNYVPASAVSADNWNAVVSVRINLVVRTAAQTEIAQDAQNKTGEVKNALEKPQPYQLETAPGVFSVITPPDKANYQVYSRVITLRNAAQ